MTEGQSSLKQVEVKIDGAFTTNSATQEHLPSYVGLSCAVSGYRPLNKYDAVIREGFCGHDSPTRIALSRGHDSKSPLASPDNAKEYNLTSPNPNNIAACGRQLPRQVPLLAEGMDSAQSNMNGHQTAHYSRVIKIEQVTSVDGSNSSHFNEKGFSLCNDAGSEGKSFVQQRIERLYGPAALGMAFQAKRAMLESFKQRREEKENPSQMLSQSPQGLPSVFRHLRPEFRHQLPVKPRGNFSQGLRTSSLEEKRIGSSSSSNALTNGHRVRHIPIELEKDDSLSSSEDTNLTEKSWKTLSRDLQSINGSNQKGSTELDSTITSSLNNLNLNKDVNSTSEDRVMSPSQKSPKDGHYFLKVVADEISLLEPKIEKVEEDLKTSGDVMTEEIRGKLLAASGKAKLLVSQKIEQFKGLCQKNINKSTTEEFPTTDEDLAGFWDMVSIQVEAVKDLLSEVETLRKNNWKEVSPVSPTEPVKKSTATRKLKSGSGRAPSSQKSATSKDSAKKKADEERRRQMRETLNSKRRQAAKLKNTNQGAEVEIFIPEK